MRDVASSLRAKFDDFHNKFDNWSYQSKFDGWDISSRHLLGQELLAKVVGNPVVGKIETLAAPSQAAPSGQASSVASNTAVLPTHSDYRPLTVEGAPSAPSHNLAGATRSTISDQLAGKDTDVHAHPGEGKGAISAPASFSASQIQGAINIAPSELLVDGTIGPGELDVYSANLVAGQTYVFSVYGSGGDPLNDTLLLVADDLGNILDLDDDGGAATNSLITYTATYTGEHLIAVGGFGSASGDYTLDFLLAPAADLVSDEFATAAPLTIGGVSYGYIDGGPSSIYYPGYSETDTFAFQVEAGKVYTIEVAGGADYASDYLDLPPGELDPRIYVWNSEGFLVTQNDDIAFPNDVSSRVSFVAQETGTYYLDVNAYPNLTSGDFQSGGYTITTQELDPADFSPLDAINWFSADNVPFDETNTAYVYFALAGESFGELADNGVDPLPSFGWNDREKAQVMQALEEYEKILGVNYEITTDVNEATFRLITTTSTQYGAYFYPQDPAYGSQQGIGAFNVNSGGWDKLGFSTQDIPGDQVSLTQGGFSFAVILHEFGHAHGLAHPHDTGGGSDVMLGVAASTGSYGLFDLNQGVYTVMSYNDAWDFHPDGPTPFTIGNIDSGWSGTLSAFDIAVLQQRYGVINPYATGNDTYLLGDVNDAGTYYECIWDTGGTDVIQYNGARNARIDLLAATLDYSPTGGGAISFVDDIWGGYTIANGVVIENATAGSGHDALLGNAASNVLNGNGGDDILIGRQGADHLNGGAGFDTASYIDAAAGVKASLGGANTGGDAAGDVFNSIEALEGSNFADSLTGSNSEDTIDGLDGDDTITGANKDDTLNGGGGNDNIAGGNHDDQISGDDGDDTLLGDNHNDVLLGGAGNDYLDGGNQSDVLNGGEGDDFLLGGKQADIFVFTDLGGLDEIGDFKKGEDKVDLSDLDAIDGGGHDAFSWIGSSSFSGVAGQLRSFTSGSDKFVAGDTDGDGLADFVIQTNVLLAQSDFILS